MATQKVRPDPSVLDQHRQVRQIRSRQRKIGVFVVIAVIVVGGIAAAIALNDPSPKAVERPNGGTNPVAPEGDVKLIDLATGEVRSGPELGPAVDHVAVSPDGTKVAYISWGGGRVGSRDRVRRGHRRIERAGVPDDTGARRCPDAGMVSRRFDHRVPGEKVSARGSWGTCSSSTSRRGKCASSPTSGSVSDGSHVPGVHHSYPSGDAVLFTAAVLRRPRLDCICGPFPVTGGDPTLIRRTSSSVRYRRAVREDHVLRADPGSTGRTDPRWPLDRGHRR